MSKRKGNQPASEAATDANSLTELAVVTLNINSAGDSARRAEHRCQSILATHAANSNSLEVTRPTVTNCPDGGHDLGVTGETEEVKELVSTLTGRPLKDLNFLDKSAKDRKLKVRIDVKNGKTISGDTIDKHTSDSIRSPDCQINLLVLTNENVKVTPEAKKRLKKQQELFKAEGTLIDIAEPDGLKRVVSRSMALAESKDGEEESL
ncbi:hypothetical protein RIE95_02175 [Acidithiobacillus thiooxidans]|uniref:hypothetical protein n=1 Tax=Acidithiobacillus thiooxidans TaxID=930 RepID=UPI00285B4A33|nr:hypothetical protein [Acidithiobacillus thiooxidans]MDR7925812.1 hypothetical protein [Acidithiobacillus thiooxidans]